METLAKNVGKLSVLLIALLCCQGVEAASIVLRVFDTQGRELTSVGVGQPFILKVAMEGFTQNNNTLLIPHLDEIQARYSGKGYNSLLQSYVTYNARIDHKGTYTVGPAEREHDGRVVQSNVLTIEVHDNPTALNSSKKNNGAQPVFAQFFVDNTHVVVNQTILCTVRFYYAAASGVTGDMQLNTPQLPGFHMDKAVNTGTGEEKKEGVPYHYVEWQWHLYPEEAGTKMIPAYSIDFAKRMTSRHSFFGLTYQDIQRTHTNSVHLSIDPLPPHETPITAVGTFTELAMTLTPTTVREGEAALLTIDLVGHGNTPLISSFPLSSLPDTIKCYESKTYTHTPTHTNELPKKSFDFIIQGLKAGESIIPQQHYTYFNTEDKQYHTLHAPALSLSITPAPVSATPPPIVSEKAPASEPEKPSQLPLNTQNPWYPVQTHTPIPFWAFVLATIAPLFAYASIIIRAYLSRYYQHHKQHIIAKRAFITARSHLRSCTSHNQHDALYGIFTRLIAQRCMVPEALITKQWIHALLTNKHYSSPEIEQWEKFFDTLASLSFAEPDTHSLQDTHNTITYTQLEQWIAWLEKKL